MILLDKGRLLVAFEPEAELIIKTIRDVNGVMLTEAERFYVNHIVSGLKGIGIWGKIKALYGFVGGTAATHRWNWKDMRDLDAAYTLSYYGGITHDSKGVSANGINGFINTKISSNSINKASFHCMVYANYTDLSFSSRTFTGIYDTIRTSINNSSTFSSFTNITTSFDKPISSNPGVLGLSRASNTESFAYYNDLIVANQNNFTTYDISNRKFFLFNRNTDSSLGIDPTLFLKGTISCSMFSEAMTVLECKLISHIITTAQGILNRQ
ncbi:hypothetical protein [Pedobacter sp. UBA4863]|uniref:hypothetical protein n=1 Tax=Pedobacter sp. UBA4863 TaxID=1947060 RepID=UPI0025E5F381|nr:hypothetical protein [Pedobacter sp. UBA4863]